VIASAVATMMNSFDPIVFGFIGRAAASKYVTAS